MSKKVILVIMIALVTANKINSQINRKFEDSLAISFLQNNEPEDKIGIIKDTINGKVNEIKNYYSYESFQVKISTTESIVLLNFGTFNTERPIYMAVIDDSNSVQKILIFGNQKLEKDLDALNTFFKSKVSMLKEENKIEILELFLKCRQGQRKTQTYIH